GDARATVRNQHIGFVFQSFNLIGDLSVLDNVGLPLKFRGGVSRAERARRAEESLQRVGLAQRLKHFRTSSPAVSSSAWRSRARWSGSPT
ncbi:ABC transporter, ATP-binding protein, partial [mine drainage metagenome]